MAGVSAVAFAHQKVIVAADVPIAVHGQPLKTTAGVEAYCDGKKSPNLSNSEQKTASMIFEMLNKFRERAALAKGRPIRLPRTVTDGILFVSPSMAAVIPISQRDTELGGITPISTKQVFLADTRVDNFTVETSDGSTAFTKRRVGSGSFRIRTKTSAYQVTYSFGYELVGSVIYVDGKGISLV